MYILDLIFQVQRPVRSLPRWHGARWSAWFRECCRALPFRLEDFMLSLLPARAGQRPFSPGEMLTIRVVVTCAGLSCLPVFLRTLALTGGGGEFSAQTLLPRAVVAVPSGALLWQDGRPTGLGAPEFACADFEEEAAALAGLSSFCLYFPGPLRLPLPPWLERGKAEIAKFCRPGHFADPRLLAHLLARIRGLDEAAPLGELPVPDASGLYWDDMRYNENRRIALGGICGVLALTGRPGLELARRLILGQYLGAGKNGRFGLGFWEIRAQCADSPQKRAPQQHFPLQGAPTGELADERQICLRFHSRHAAHGHIPALVESGAEGRPG